MTRDIASSFNNVYGETFVIPEPLIDERVMIIPGTDGEKMSKSYNNYIDIFLPEKELKKQILNIVTDSTPLEQPKNPDMCNVFALFQLLASASQTEEMKANYSKGNYGYGHAKNALLTLILDSYKTQREAFNQLMNDKQTLNSKLQLGAEKARKTARSVLKRVREKLGYGV